MRRWLLLTALVALVPSAAAAEGDGKKAPPPVTPIVGPATPISDMMVGVQRLQAEMAQGDKDAYGQQRARLKEVGAAIYAAGSDAFKIKVERDAVVVFLLSGGQPRDVAKILDRGDFPDGEGDLLRGAAGYALGRTAVAEKLLAFDPKKESLRLGAQLAYAQSVLETPKDAKKALELLDLARLLAPGGLIEEAALRREILLVGDLRDADRVSFLARQYVERFGKSIYAANFVQGLAAAAVNADLCDNLANLDKFSALLELVAPDQRRSFLLAVSRSAALRGHFDVASQAAQRARPLAAAGSLDEARARLYDVMSRFPSMSEAEQIAAFAAVDRKQLSAEDRELMGAAMALHDRMYEPAPLEDFDDIWREALVAAARSPDLAASDDPASETTRRAVAALNVAEALGGKESSR